MTEKQYYPTGELELVIFRNESGQWDRADGPAVTKYNKDGSIQYELFYKNGKCHRHAEPAFITFGSNSVYEGFFLNDKIQTHKVKWTK
jgi:hypothetical protein